MSTIDVRDETAEAILVATLAVVRERGLSGATTRLIAARADVNEVTLFRKFETKSNLLRAAIAYQLDSARAELIRYSGDIEADLAGLAERYRDMLDQCGPFVRAVLIEGPSDLNLVEAMDDVRELYESITRVLSRYVEQGRLRTQPEGVLVAAFLGPIFMAHATGLISPRADATQSCSFDVAAHVGRFLYGHAAR